MSNKNKKIYATLNYIEHFLTLAFAVTVCISISAFASLIDISKGIMSSTKGLNICAVVARIKKHKSIIKKNKNKPNEQALLAKTNLDCTKGSTSSFLTDSYIKCNYFLLTNVLRKYNNKKKSINLKLHKLLKLLIYTYKTMSSCRLKCRKNTESKNPKVVKTKNGRKMLLSKCAV